MYPVVLIMQNSVKDITALNNIIEIESYVHCDAKSDCIHGNKCTKIPFQTYGRWGSPELAFAQLESMLYIIDHNPNVSSVIAISDDSIPVVARGNVLANYMLLSNSGTKSLIQSELDLGEEYNKRSYYGISSKFTENDTNRKITLPIYKGSQWNALTRYDLERIRHFLYNNPLVLEELYYTKILDERLFATLANLIGLEFINLRYVYAPFSSDMKTGRLITESEIKNLQSSDYLFARKWKW